MASSSKILALTGSLPDTGLLGRIVAGKFRLDDVLGQGAMGVVYRAHHLTLDVPVALKLLHVDLTADDRFAQRFEREARIACSFAHANSVRVLDYGAEADGTLYLAMEYIAGRDLFTVLQDSESGRLEPERAAMLVSQVLSALGAAHAVGVVHRDVKPENVLIVEGTDDDGNAIEIVKMCDFGIASIASARGDDRKENGSRLTMQGLIIGTPAYMSPEQAKGDRIDARSDLYAVGIMLYQLLTGHVPFDADEPLALLLKHLTDRPPAPESLHPGVHAELADVALMAMEKDPKDRPQTARAMRGAVRLAMGWVDGEAYSMRVSNIAEYGAIIESPRREGRRSDAPSRVKPPPAAMAPTAAEFPRPDTARSFQPHGRAETASLNPVSPPTPFARITPVDPSAIEPSPIPPSPAHSGDASRRRRNAFAAASVALVLAVWIGGRALTHGASPAVATSAASPGRAGVDEPAVRPALTGSTPFARPDAPGLPPAADPSVPSSAPSGSSSGAPKTSEPGRTVQAARTGTEESPPTQGGKTAPLVSTGPSAPQPPPAATTTVLLVPEKAPEIATTPGVGAPVATPTTAAIATPAAVVSAPTAPSREAARVALGEVTSPRGVTPRSVSTGVANVLPRIVECYRASFSGTPGSGQGTVHLDTDGEGFVTSAVAHLPIAPAAARCVERAVVGIQFSGVDTGEATADVTLSFSDQ